MRGATDLSGIRSAYVATVAEPVPVGDTMRFAHARAPRRRATQPRGRPGRRAGARRPRRRRGAAHRRRRAGGRRRRRHDLPRVRLQARPAARARRRRERALQDAVISGPPRSAPARRPASASSRSSSRSATSWATTASCCWPPTSPHRWRASARPTHAGVAPAHRDPPTAAAPEGRCARARRPRARRLHRRAARPPARRPRARPGHAARRDRALRAADGQFLSQRRRGASFPLDGAGRLAT